MLRSTRRFKLLGLEPITLDSDEGLFKEVSKIAERYMDRCDRSKVPFPCLSKIHSGARTRAFQECRPEN